MVRVVIASVVSLLALPAAAHASSLDAKPPPKSVAGVKITWPLKANAVTLMDPGAKVSVKVRSEHRRAVISLLRADARGIPTRLLARRTLRSGTFTAALPADQGVLYQLRAVVNGRRYWAWIATIVPVPPKAVDPMPVLGSLACDIAPTGRIELDPATVTPGVQFMYRVTSTTAEPDLGGAWQRKDAGAWVAYPDGQVEPANGAPATFAGLERHATLPAGAPSGTYRLVETLEQPGGSACGTEAVAGPEIVVP
jgi:hypothetical protein